MQRSRKSRTRLFKTVATLFMAAGAIVSIFPFLWMISTSFKVEDRCAGISDPVDSQNLEL